MLELRGPVVATLEVTAEGATWPTHAYFKQKSGISPLTATQWGAIIDKLGPFVSEFRISGGEPLARPDLFEILDHLERAKRPYHLFTHGLWPDRPAALLGFKRLSYIQSFLIYLHGADAATHSHFAGCDAAAFDEVLRTLELVAASGLEVSTSTVITRQCSEQLEALVEQATLKGARHSVFNRYVGPPRPDIEPSPDELRQALSKLDEMRQLGYNIALGSCVPACFHEELSQGCSAGITYCAIDPWGGMRPCDHSPTVVGSLLNDDVTALWRSKAMRAWRTNLPAACRSCSKLSFCPGGCRSEAEVLGVAADPLIGKPLDPEAPTLLEVTLEDELCPVPMYAVRQEDFGWALIRQTQVIPVTHKAGKVLTAFDGKTTLGDIEQQFGAGALSFVYSLYERSFVDFRPRATSEA